MANRTARTKRSPRHNPARKTGVTKRPGRAPNWKIVLERNLIREGYSPAEAKELVAISAA